VKYIVTLSRNVIEFSRTSRVKVSLIVGELHEIFSHISWVSVPLIGLFAFTSLLLRTKNLNYKPLSIL